MVLLVLYLYQTLPQLIPRTNLDFVGKLADKQVSRCCYISCIHSRRCCCTSRMLHRVTIHQCGMSPHNGSFSTGLLHRAVVQSMNASAGSSGVVFSPSTALYTCTCANLVLALADLAAAGLDNLQPETSSKGSSADRRSALCKFVPAKRPQV